MATEQPHKHINSCYATQLDCPTAEHEHVDRACYYQRGEKTGQLKCTMEEHLHRTQSCYVTYTKCGYP